MKPLLAFLMVTGVALAQDFRVGSAVSDFPLHDLDGKATSFAALKGKVTVVAFVAVECPVSNAYNDRMSALYKDYSGRVNFVFVNSNSTESADEVRRHARDSGFPFLPYKDPNNVVADKFGASKTPEIYVIDSSSTLRYHGPIDDSQNPARIKTQHLRATLDALLEGKPIPAAEIAAFGCTIKKVRKTGASH